jgi:arginine/lysine/ornithine decarboxylase
MPLLSPLSIGEGLPALPPVSLSVRDAYLSPAESVPIERCTGRVLHFLHVTCPPAIPPVVPGEVLTEEVIAYLKAMGYASLSVVRER